MVNYPYFVNNAEFLANLFCQKRKDFTVNTIIRLLEAIRETGINCKFYQASSSEMYGKVQEIPQSEKTPFYPRSPYAAAKVYAYWMTLNYREAYHIFACNDVSYYSIEVII